MGSYRLIISRPNDLGITPSVLAEENIGIAEIRKENKTHPLPACKPD